MYTPTVDACFVIIQLPRAFSDEKMTDRSKIKQTYMKLDYVTSTI